MKYKLDKELSPELEQFRDEIEATIQPYIAISPQVKDDLSLWISKFGGVPYFPKGMDYPRTSKGDYLNLLAQINFAEVPALEGFPQQGILQFYIADDESLGLDFDNPKKQDRFRIIYFPNPHSNENNLVTNFDFLPDIDYSPIFKPCGLTFEMQVAPITCEDHHFEKILGQEFQNLPQEKQWNLIDTYCEDMSVAGSKLGGYPNFIQNDPRPYLKSEGEEEYILLLQIDSDNEGNILWGDVGVGNFFIQASALKRLDFSNVIYNWDCA